MAIQKYDNPYGSVSEDDYTIYGKNGGNRHRGNFSSDNPYLEQLAVANKNQDIDALYERAINWEADNAKLLEQRAYDKQVLAEQRAYDDPVNEVARQRVAGINVDLQGGSSGGSSVSGGSSAQLTPREQTTSQAQTQFSNAYGNTDRVFAGINAAAGLVSSLSGAFSSITQGISNIKLLKPQKELMEAQAKLGRSQANEIDTLLDGKKRAQTVQNITSYVGLASKLQGMLKVDFSDDEATQLYTTLGIPETEHAGLSRSIRSMNERPEILAQWNKDKVDQRWAESEEKFIDSRFTDKMVDLTNQVELATKQFEVADAIIMSSIESALAENLEYIDDLIRSEVLDADIATRGKTLELDNLKRDVKAWGRIWDGYISALKLADKQLDIMEKEFKADGKWTKEEEAIYNGYWMERQALRNMLSSEHTSMRNNFINLLQKRYETRLLGPNGELANMDFIGAIANFSNAVFDENYQNLPSGGEIIKGWLVGLGDIAVNAGEAIAFKGGKGVSKAIRRGQQAYRTYRRSNP